MSVEECSLQGLAYRRSTPRHQRQTAISMTWAGEQQNEPRCQASKNPSIWCASNPSMTNAQMALLYFAWLEGSLGRHCCPHVRWVSQCYCWQNGSQRVDEVSCSSQHTSSFLSPSRLQTWWISWQLTCLAHARISPRTEKHWETTFLLQWLSIALQKCDLIPSHFCQLSNVIITGLYTLLTTSLF